MAFVTPKDTSYNNILFVFPFGVTFIFGTLLCFDSSRENPWQNDLKMYPVPIPNPKGSFQSNNLQDIIDIQKLNSELPLAMKLYYSERTAIINPPKSVKNVAINVAKKILMY